MCIIINEWEETHRVQHTYKFDVVFQVTYFKCNFKMSVYTVLFFLLAIAALTTPRPEFGGKYRKDLGKFNFFFK